MTSYEIIDLDLWNTTDYVRVCFAKKKNKKPMATIAAAAKAKTTKKKKKNLILRKNWNK